MAKYLMSNFTEPKIDCLSFGSGPQARSNFTEPPFLTFIIRVLIQCEYAICRFFVLNDLVCIYAERKS